MIILKKSSSFNAKKNAEAYKLSTKLQNIDREMKNDLRMLDNQKLRFKARYSKSSFDSSMNEASDVKMYETHNPGFCYRRNGEHRMQLVPKVVPSFDFEHLRFLLFTGEEVDIGKLLCLHLLSTHKTEDLKAPKRPRQLSQIVYKKHSPLEHLLLKSTKEKHNQLVKSMVLPPYILDIGGASSSESLTSVDERLTSRLLVNEVIVELIKTVTSTLETSNKEKMEQLRTAAENLDLMKELLQKPYIQEFMESLKNHSIISSCGSFVLTQPLRIKTSTIDVPNEKFKPLVHSIRQNVLQLLPDCKILRKMNENHPQNKAILGNPNDSALPLSSPAAKSEEEKNNYVETAQDVLKRNINRDLKNLRHTSVNYVQKNIAAISNYKRTIDNSRQHYTTSLLTGRQESRKSSISSSRRSSQPDSLKRKMTNDSDTLKWHLKQTTCPACMVKWKTPLPAPKVPKLGSRRNSTVEKEEELQTGKILKADSIQKISMLLEEEQYLLDSYDRKFSVASNNSQIAAVAANTNNKTKNPEQKDSSSDYMRLDVFDLEKIKLEIREKEVKKKVENFLKS